MTSRETELSYFFMIMGNLASAKAGNDLEAVADCVADLEAIAMHAEAARVRRSAGAELTQASELLADMQSQRFGYSGPVVVTVRADAPANLN